MKTRLRSLLRPTRSEPATTTRNSLNEISICRPPYSDSMDTAHTRYASGPGSRRLRLSKCATVRSTHLLHGGRDHRFSHFARDPQRMAVS
jgi:hypothetical protein